MTTAVPIATTETATMSAVSTPNTEPNNTASMLFFACPYLFSSAKPSANDAVVTTPIAASAPISRRRAIRPMMIPDATPQIPAPMK